MKNSVRVLFGRCQILVIMVISLSMTSCATRQEKIVIVTHTGAARNVTRLTQTPQDEIYPVVSPDGQTVAFQVLKDKQYDIWTMDSATGRNLIQVTSHSSHDVQPSWMPDSKTLVFSSNRLGNFSLWKQLASGGGGTTMITKGADMSDFAPAVSPDGKKIAFTSKGLAKETLVAIGAKQYIVFEKNLPTIWTVNVDGTELTQFAQGAYPVWSPDGKRIAFSSDVSGNWDIWMMNADGSGLTQITNDPKQQFSPSFSPDGKWITYSSNVSGHFDIWIMKADGSAQTQLTTDKSEASTPFWGRDGNIYFSSNKAGNWDIWRLTPVLPE
jgi:TolB protein